MGWGLYWRHDQHQLTNTHRTVTGFAPLQKIFERDAGRCACCGLSAHLLYVAACAAPPTCGIPPQRRSSSRRWGSVPILKTVLKTHMQNHGLAAWRASAKGKAKNKDAILLDALRAASEHVRAHSWPPAVLLALSSGCDDTLFDAAALEQGEESDLSGSEDNEDFVPPSSDDAPCSAVADAADCADVLALGTQLHRWLSTNGFHTATKATALQAGHFWQSDHINPVAEGGGSCGLDNLRTLCTPCHAVETARLSARLAELRKHGKDEARGAQGAKRGRKASPLDAAASSR